MDSVIIAAIITGILTIIGIMVGGFINSERVIFTNLGWKKKLPKGFIFLINGSSGVGKTTLAWALARKYNIVSVFSTDYIREAYRYLLTNNEIKNSKCIFKSSFLAHEGLDEEINENDRVVIGFIKQTEFLTGPLINVINRIRNKRDPAIIEGVNLIASQVFSELPTDPLNRIVLINLYLEDTNVHLKRLRERGEKASEKLELTDRYISNLENIRIIDNFLKVDTNKTKNNCINIINIENSSPVSKTLDKIDNHIKELQRKFKMK